MDSLARDDRETASVILRQALVISKTSFRDRGDYYAKLEKIGFSPVKIYQKGHLMNVIAWDGGTRRLRNILDSMQYELLLSEGVAAELPPPEKVTLTWLSRHLPWHLWIVAIGILLAAIGIGLRLGQNDSFMRVIDLFTKHPTP